jgi:uncharacterized LabA/DUF88 family protein
MKSINLKHKLKAGVFIDDANLFYSQQKNGWKIDISKLKRLLEMQFSIEIFQYYLTVPGKSDPALSKTIKYIGKISKYATIRTKPLKYIHSKNNILKKGNVDIEIALDVVRNLERIDLVIVLTGDSDYCEIRRFVLENNKKIIFLGFRKTMSWELKRGKYFYLDSVRKYLERGKKTTPGTMPGRLLLDILYQKKQKKSSKTKLL